MRALIYLFAAGLFFSACEEKPAKVEIRTKDRELTPFKRKGEKVTLRLAIKDKNDLFKGYAENVKWISGDESVVAVNHDGLVESLSTGKSIITADYLGLVAKTQWTGQILASLEIIPCRQNGKPFSKKLHMGEQCQFNAVVKDDRGNVVEKIKVTWEGSNDAMIIDPDGLVEGGAMGETALIAKAGDLTAELPLEVTDFKK